MQFLSCVFLMRNAEPFTLLHVYHKKKAKWNNDVP